MDTLDRYREAISKVIDEYARYPVSHGDIATEVIVDREKDHYELVHVGWDGPRRVHGAVIHIDIIDGRVWIQHDGTESGVAEELVLAGVPRDAIVLGFHPPHVRQYTGFAVA
jgi:hypothetical protein